MIRTRLLSLFTAAAAAASPSVVMDTPNAVILSSGKMPPNPLAGFYVFGRTDAGKLRAKLRGSRSRYEPHQGAREMERRRWGGFHVTPNEQKYPIVRGCRFVDAPVAPICGA